MRKVVTVDTRSVSVGSPTMSGFDVEKQETSAKNIIDDVCQASNMHFTKGIVVPKRNANNLQSTQKKHKSQNQLIMQYW